MFKKVRINVNANSEAIIILKYALLLLLVVLVPITLFLTTFSWYASLEYVKRPNTNIESLSLFWKNALIFGSIGFMSFIVYFCFFLAFNHGLKHATLKWKKFLLFFGLIITTLLFLAFEITSGVFVQYFYTWQISLALMFWPVNYVLLFVLLLISYFELHNHEKSLKNKKGEIVEKDEIDVIRDLSETIS